MSSITPSGDLSIDLGPSPRAIAAVVLPVLLPGSSGEGEPRDPAADPLATDSAFARASVESGAAQAFTDYLADNALSLSDGRHPITGRDSIVAGMTGDYTLTWTPQRAEVAASGDMGWTWGIYVFTLPQSEGDPTVSYGKYLNVWRKDSAGHWKVAVDMGNDSPPPEQSPQR